jgi:hypothetical protein
MLLQLLGLIVLVALITVGAFWFGKNVRLGGKKSQPTDEKEN